MFFIIEDTDIASYADDNTPYVSADEIDGLIKSFEEALEILFKWYNDDLMKTNADKCHLLVSTNNTVKIKIGNFDITNSKSKKLLGVKFNLTINSLSMITFQNYVKSSYIIKSSIVYEYFKKTYSYEWVL